MESILCRICLKISDELFSLFEDDQMPHKIVTISSVWVSLLDNLPSTVCGECVENVNRFYNFRKLIIDNDVQLKKQYVLYVKEEQCYNKLEPECLNSPKVIQLENFDLEEKDYTFSINNNESAISLSEDMPTNCVKEADLHTHENTHKCDHCDFITTDLVQFKNHKRAAHYPKGICNVCGKSIRYDNLGKHVKNHKEPPVPCKKCGKVLKNSESLRAHMTNHTGQEFQCKICMKAYKYRGEFNRHLKLHALNGARTVKCMLCDKMFLDKKQAKRHLQTHTHQRPHICSFCTKGFSSTYALKTHIRQHTNEKPYICEYCSMGFPQKVSLMTHIKSKH